MDDFEDSDMPQEAAPASAPEPEIELTFEQQKAYERVGDWLENRRTRGTLKIFGGAGTGKTTLAKRFRELTDVHYMALTGKAALVLQKKGCLGATTVHSAVYKPVELPNGGVEFAINAESYLRSVGLGCCDEMGMVDNRVGQDLEYLTHKLLVLGDPNQLPPIEGAGYFSHNPDIFLEQPHRFALDSPIYQLAEVVKSGKRPKFGEYGESRVIDGDRVRTAQFDKMLLEHDIILCGRNKSRTANNRRVRELLGHQGGIAKFFPVVGDKLVCLKNNHKKGLLNGSLWEVIDLPISDMGQIVTMVVKSLDEPYRAPVEVAVPWQFFDGTEEELDWRVKANFEQFTYGYALTVHKAQGSQWDKVLLIDESKAFREFWTNHLYTGITRAAEKVTVLL